MKCEGWLSRDCINESSKYIKYFDRYDKRTVLIDFCQSCFNEWLRAEYYKSFADLSYDEYEVMKVMEL